MLITSKEEPVQALIPPGLLEAELPISEAAAETVFHNRRVITDAIHNRSDKLIVVVGPCSIHDVDAARDYASLLKEEAAQYSDQLHIVMRVYFEKPRTQTGWKGLINDPDLDQSFQVNKGLRLARKLLIDINEMGLGCACCVLDTISPNFFFDLVSWGAVGAGSTESQNHRQLCSGVSSPIGFKNGTDGNIQIAIDAIGAAKHPHCFLGVTKEGLSAILTTKGNNDCHMILRGGAEGSNYDIKSVVDVVEKLSEKDLAERIMIDCGNANCEYDHRKIPSVVGDIAQQIAAGNQHIMGVMIESNLIAGRQDISDKLRFGQSITDACIGWDETQRCLAELAEAVSKRQAR